MLTQTSGPFVTTGNLNPQQTSDSEQGPSAFFQGASFLDPRTAVSGEAAPSLGRVDTFLPAERIVLIDATPHTANAARIAAAQTATSGTAMTLATTVATSVAPGTPLIPAGLSPAVSSNVVYALALDPGYSTGHGATNGTTTVTLSSAYMTRFFYPSQKIMIAGAGAAANANLFTTVVSVSGTTLVIADAAGQTGSFPIWNLEQNYGLAVSPLATAGAMAVWDPNQVISRGVSVTSNNAADTGWTVTVRGYDIYGVLMSETISVSANATAYGNKAFKYISSVTPTKTGSTTGTLSIGTSDIFGFTLKSEYWEYVTAYWVGAQLTASTGWVAAVTASTATSADVRGTMQLGTLGPGSGATTSPNGSRRLVLSVALPIYDVIRSTNLNSTAMFGVTQFYA